MGNRHCRRRDSESSEWLETKINCVSSLNFLLLPLLPLLPPSETPRLSESLSVHCMFFQVLGFGFVFSGMNNNQT